MKQNEYLEDQLKRAYKKLKASVYYDKTLSILRDKIVKYEAENGIDEKLEKLSRDIINNWSDIEEEQLKFIGVSAFPKKLRNEDESKNENRSNSNIYSNIEAGPAKVDEIQYFINMKVEAYILGVLWVLLFGISIDSEMYEHSYGNRLKELFVNEDTENASMSPYLFKPYFQQYESWRDYGLTQAKSVLTKSNDALILMLDFKSFYYQIHINEENINGLKIHCKEKSKSILGEGLINKINMFVYKVIHEYSNKLREIDKEKVKERDILPIGFPPSNIIANFFMSKFDQAISDGWNPVYYGRYVDDILIIDKIEKNSDIFSKAKEGKITKEYIIEQFMERCSRWGRL